MELKKIVKNRITQDQLKVSTSILLDSFLRQYRGKRWIEIYHDLPKLLADFFPFGESFEIEIDSRYGMHHLKLTHTSGVEIEYLLAHDLGREICPADFKKKAAPNWDYAQECIEKNEAFLSDPSRYRKIVGAINRLKCAAQELSSDGPYFDLFPSRYEALAAAGINSSYISKMLDVNS